MSTIPARPGSEEAIDQETKRILAEREERFEEEAKAAEPWRNVKVYILKLKPPAPR